MWFLKCTTRWPYIPSTQIKIDVGNDMRFFIQACKNTVKIPEEMGNETILEFMRMAVRVSGFEGI
jgi:hypothetical protein